MGLQFALIMETFALIKNYAQSLQNKFLDGAPIRELLESATHLEGLYILLQELLPPEIQGKSSFDRHLHWMKRRLSEGSPMECQSDIEDICNHDLPAIEKLFLDWCDTKGELLPTLGGIYTKYLPSGFYHYARFFSEFLKDHPDIDRNVFLMMRFKKSEVHSRITQVLRQQMVQYGLNLTRADDKEYADDLWDNVCLYMLGSKYGVAVFEEIDEREFNPSVALELGFMLAQNKRCLILKDRRMPKMPTDIVGKLYKEFDTYNIENSIIPCVQAWVRDIGLVR